MLSLFDAQAFGIGRKLPSNNARYFLLVRTGILGTLDDGSYTFTV